MPDLPRPHVILNILEEHFEELDSLWEQRERIIFSPQWNLARLAALEDRADAQLEGLRVGAGHAVDLARPFVGGKEASAATAAGFTLMAMDQPEPAREVLRALVEGSPAIREGIRIALRHSHVAPVLDELTRLVLSGDPLIRAAALDVLAFHRMPAPPEITELFAIQDPVVRRTVVTSLGRLGGPWSVDLLSDALESEDSDLRGRALETSARLAMPGLVMVCRGALERALRPLPEAVVTLGVLGQSQDLGLLKDMLAVPDLAPAALAGLGAMGSVSVIPHLLSLMGEPTLSVAAGAAFVRITGAEGLETAVPEPASRDPSEEELDLMETAVSLNPEIAKSWWEENELRFDPVRRWQYGIDVDRLSFTEASWRLPLSARRDLYLARRASGRDLVPDVELEARARLQAKGLNGPYHPERRP